MYIFTNNQSMISTPAHVYNGTSDFATILEDMKKGELPTGTGQPFPVNFDAEGDQMLSNNAASPWAQKYTNNMGEPLQPMGPEIFGIK